MCDKYQSNMKQWFDEIYIPHMKMIFPNLHNPSYISSAHKGKIFLVLVTDKEVIPDEGIRFNFQTGHSLELIIHMYQNLLKIILNLICSL